MNNEKKLHLLQEDLLSQGTVFLVQVSLVLYFKKLQLVQRMLRISKETRVTNFTLYWVVQFYKCL